MRWNILSIRGHYEVYALDGSFLLSADTRAEAEEELFTWGEERID